MLNFNDNKAGMAGLDKELITKVINENTSANYFEFSKKQKQRVDEKVKELKFRLESSTNRERANANEIMNTLTTDLELQRDLSRDCVCIDMDAFFAAVEMRDDPRLRTIPMAVGSSSMLSTSNYLARRFGVRAAMPGFIAKKLCPQLELVPGDYKKYSKVSKEFSAVFGEYDPEMSTMSLDEAYLDLTEYVAERKEPKTLIRKRYGGECICRLPRFPEGENAPEERQESEECKKCKQTCVTYSDDVVFGIGRAEVVREIRFRVEQTTGLTCSAGIAANFMLAKICSDLNKPNGQFELPNERESILKFLNELPIRKVRFFFSGPNQMGTRRLGTEHGKRVKVSGIGRVCEAHLQACGIATVGDMLEKKALLPLVFSPLAQESFLRTALGLSGRPSSGDPRRKSISIERTFGATSKVSQLLQEHQELCRMLHEDLTKTAVIGGKTITMKLKLASFDVLTRSYTASRVISSLEDIMKFSLELLAREFGQEIRLLGVRLSQLTFAYDSPSEPSTSGTGKANAPKNMKTIVDFWKNSKVEKVQEAVEVQLSNNPEQNEERAQLESEQQEEFDKSLLLLPSREKESEILNVEEKSASVNCPICCCTLPNDDVLVNRHVDECLNEAFLKEDRPETSIKGRKTGEKTPEGTEPPPKRHKAT